MIRMIPPMRTIPVIRTIPLNLAMRTTPMVSTVPVSMTMSRPRRMMGIVRVCGCALALVVLGAPAEVGADTEDSGAHAKHPMRTVVIGDGIRPETTNLSAGEVIVFQNHFIQPVTVTFTEPKDLKERIRCTLVRGGEATGMEAPWQLFTWQDERLVAIIPPGRFAAVCSLAQGTYTFQVTHQGGRATPGELPDEGSIIVR